MEVKRKDSVKRVLWLSYFSMKHVLDKILGPAVIVVETLAKKLQQAFLLSLKMKGLEVNFCQHHFKCNVQ